jgi:hypothetical protein
MSLEFELASASSGERPTGVIGGDGGIGVLLPPARRVGKLRRSHSIMYLEDYEADWEGAACAIALQDDATICRS